MPQEKDSAAFKTAFNTAYGKVKELIKEPAPTGFFERLQARFLKFIGSRDAFDSRLREALDALTLLDQKNAQASSKDWLPILGKTNDDRYYKPSEILFSFMETQTQTRVFVALLEYLNTRTTEEPEYTNLINNLKTDETPATEIALNIKKEALYKAWSVVREELNQKPGYDDANFLHTLDKIKLIYPDTVEYDERYDREHSYFNRFLNWVASFFTPAARIHPEPRIEPVTSKTTPNLVTSSAPPPKEPAKLTPIEIAINNYNQGEISWFAVLMEEDEENKKLPADQNTSSFSFFSSPKTPADWTRKVEESDDTAKKEVDFYNRLIKLEKTINDSDKFYKSDMVNALHEHLLQLVPKKAKTITYLKNKLESSRNSESNTSEVDILNEYIQLADDVMKHVAQRSEKNVTHQPK
jgi:hypothetical protein